MTNKTETIGQNGGAPESIVNAASALVAPYGGRVVFAPAGTVPADARKGYLSVMEACRYLHVSPTTFYQFIRTADIKGYRLPGGIRKRYRVADIDAAMKVAEEEE